MRENIRNGIDYSTSEMVMGSVSSCSHDCRTSGKGDPGSRVGKYHRPSGGVRPPAAVSDHKPQRVVKLAETPLSSPIV